MRSGEKNFWLGGEDQKALSPDRTSELKLESENEPALQRSEGEPSRQREKPVCKGPESGKGLVCLGKKAQVAGGSGRVNNRQRGDRDWQAGPAQATKLNVAPSARAATESF